MPFGNFLQSDAQLVCAYQARRNVSVRGGGDVELGRSPGWNPVRADWSRLFIYTFVERKSKDQEVYDQAEPVANIRNDLTCSLGLKCEMNWWIHPISWEDRAWSWTRGITWILKISHPWKWFKLRKQLARPIIRRSLFCSIPVLKCQSSTLPFLVIYSALSTESGLKNLSV